MLTGLRRYLGQSWTPLRIEVEYDRPRRWRALEKNFARQSFSPRTPTPSFSKHTCWIARRSIPFPSTTWSPRATCARS
jgi:hypothetical protein